jgi:hypothetical protein
MLADAHRRHLGLALAEAELAALWRLVTCFAGAESRAELLAAGRSLERLLHAFVARVPLSAAERQDVLQAASRQWWEAVNRSAYLLGERSVSSYGAIPVLAGYAPGRLETWRRRVGRTLRHTRRALLGSA